MTNKQISCAEHDYIEIVCMKRYPIKLTMKSGSIIECIAIDTKLNEEKVECIQVDEKGDIYLIDLSAISRLEVGVDNPHFKSVSFD